MGVVEVPQVPQDLTSTLATAKRPKGSRSSPIHPVFQTPRAQPSPTFKIRNIS